MRILFVEDIPADVELAERALRREGLDFSSTRVETKPAFLTALEHFQPDVVISDYSMPEFDGRQALKLTQEYDPTLPFILFTGSLNEETAVACMKAGATDYVIKEQMARLPFAVLEALEQKKARQAKLEAEQALFASEKRFRSLIENSTDMIAILGPDNALRYISPSVQRIMGYTVPELIGNSITKYVHPDDLPAFLEAVRQRVRATRVGPASSEFRFQHKNGSWRVLEGMASNLLDEPAILGIVINARDITERKQAEAQLYVQSAALNSAANAISIIDSAGVIEWVNPAFLSLFGYSAEEVEGKTLQDLVRSFIHDEEFYKRMWDTTHAGEVWQGEIVDRRKDGSLITLEQTITPVMGAQGEVSHFITIQQDVTPRKRVEEQINRQLRRLAALHTIDTTISGSLDLQLSLNTVLREARAQLEVDAASILLLNPHLQMLEYAAGSGFRTEALQHTRLRLGESYAGEAALESRLVSLPDLRGRQTSFLRSPSFLAEGFIAYYAVPLSAKGFVKGVLEIFHRSPLSPEPEWLNFLEILAGQAAIAIDNAQLFSSLQRANRELSVAYDATIEGWSRALDLRDKETEGHTQRVTEMTLHLAQLSGIADEQLVHIRRGSLLHDIGKLGVPDYILHKPGPLTDEEWAIMKKHPVYAFEMLSPIAYLQPAIDIPYCHHEKWDGSGYPRGLAGPQIPIAASIFSVVDVWDALISNRPYRPAWSVEQARAYIEEESGKAFNPRVVEVFLRSGFDSIG